MNINILNRLHEVVTEYKWHDKYGLIVFINYGDCEEVFNKMFNVDSERCPDCKACSDCICVTHFEDFLNYYFPLKDIEEIFEK